MSNSYSFQSFPVINSERLSLRAISRSDASTILTLRSDDYVTKFIARPKMKSEKEALQFISDRKKDNANYKVFYWAIELKSNNKMIGTVCLWNFSKDKKYAEIGYELLPTYFGNGYMDEAIKEVVKFGFKTIELQTIEAFTHYDNVSSIKLLEKNKFILQVKRRDEGFPNNRIFSLKV